MDAWMERPQGGMPEALAPILTRYLEAAGLDRPQTMRRLSDAWCQAVGPETAAHTRLTGFRKNVLEVEVDSAARLHELASFHKRAILARLGETLRSAHVADIRFRPAAWGGAT